ncbi:MAG: hypothetical protein AB4372_22040 [Xenococcus sp. (in: cyanobacteria)]
MLSNITSNYPKETELRPGQKVYLYGDRRYEGKLIRPLERTYPQKWTVQLEIGGYVAANVAEIFALKSSYSEQSEADIPFSEKPESAVISQLKQKIKILENNLQQLQAENQLIEHRYYEVERENQTLKQDLEQAKQTIRQAKDISPIVRLSLKRVLRLAHQACMDVQRTVGGWILKMGAQARKFCRLADIWEILSVDEFILSEIFPEDKLIALDQIKPPRRRKKPEPREKKTFPLMHPQDIMRNRTMSLVKSG